MTLQDDLKLFSSGQPVYMNAAEGSQLLQAGLIDIHQNNPCPTDSGRVQVTLNQAGTTALANLPVEQAAVFAPPVVAPQPVAAPPVAPVAAPTPVPVVGVVDTPGTGNTVQTQIAEPPQDGFGIDAVPYTKKTKTRSTKTDYPFPQLEIGHSFHVPCPVVNPTEDDLKVLLKTLRASVSAAHRKFSEEIPGEFVDVKAKRIMKDANGNPVLDAEGNKQKAVTVEKVPKKRQTKAFKAFIVDGSDPRGAGVRVARVEL